MMNGGLRFKTGDLVYVRCGDQQVLAKVTLASRNGRSLLLTLSEDVPLRLPTGGMYFRDVPVLLDEHGVYRDVAGNVELRIESVRFVA